jgi:carbamoyl-phosphate synthase large subunit
MTKEMTVAVTGLHRGDNPQPGAAVIRSLRRQMRDLRVVALSYDPLESALYSHDIDRVDAVYLLPFPSKGPDRLLDRMSYIQKRENIDLLVPCLDSELGNFMTISGQLKREGIATVLPTPEAFECRAKENLTAFCDRHGIAGPKTFAASDVATLAQRAAEIGYPVYIKGRYYEAYLVYTPVELAEKFDAIVRVWGVPVLVQEALFGDEFDLVGLADDASEIVGHCAIRKLLRTHNGKGFAGVVVNDPAIERAARHIIKTLHWRGPFEIEFLQMQHGSHLLFEINPRFPAWVDFPSQIGCNLPLRLLETLLGRRTTKLETCDAGQMFIRHSIDLVGDIAELAKLSSDGEYVAGPLAPKLELVP